MLYPDRPRGRIDGTQFSVPIEVMRARVEQEIADYAALGRSRMDYLNNFYNWLIYPADGKRCAANYRWLLTMSGEDYHIKHQQRDFGVEKERFSLRYLAVSDAEFVADIDNAMAAEGVYADVARLMREHEITEQTPEASNRFAEYILPVYVQLRALGYAHQEIAA